MKIQLMQLIDMAFDAAVGGMTDGRGGPFGAVVAKDGVVLSAASNRVVRDRDPTAHAEMAAIREACRKVGDHRLNGCEIICTCEPCPMCLAAIYWARIDRVYFAAARSDARQMGFDDELIYNEIGLDAENRSLPMIHVPSSRSDALLGSWASLPSKVPY